MKGFSSRAVMYLAAFSGCVLFSYNTVLKRARDSRTLRESWTNPVEVVNQFDDVIEMEDGRRLTADDYMHQRIAEVMRETWPECVKNRMIAQKCKEFIDEEILTTFTGRDRYIRVIIKDKRKQYDEWYNTVVIYINDRHLVVGRDGDGIAYYDFEWDGSGEPATPEEETEIPPVFAMANPYGAPDADPNVLGPKADPNSPEYEPLDLEPEPIMVIGCTVDGAASGADHNPIAGGVVTDPDDPNDPEGDDKLQAAKDEAEANKDPDGNPIVPAAGPRYLPAFDCTGMTGYNCCLMIKLKVRDHDMQGKAIQCQLIYEEASTKEKFHINLRGKKVIIHANHNEIVSKIPKIVGDWPPGQKTTFGDWLEDGGDPNREDWIPPNDI